MSSALRTGGRLAYVSFLDSSTMLYFHGGAYFFGSLNTHRYAIWRFARKAGHRAFGESLPRSFAKRS